MVSHITKKHSHKRKNVTHKSKHIIKDKKCMTDDEMGQICSTGQYSTYEGNFYKNPDNLVKFQEVKDLFKTNPKYAGLKTYNEKYTALLKQNFSAGEVPKLLKKVKNDYYSYVNDEWFNQNDIEEKSNYYVQFDSFRIVQEQVYYKLISYVKDYIKEHPKDKKAIALNNVYKSLSNNTIKKTLIHVDAVINELAGFVERDDMYGLLAMVNSNETISWCSPIQWTLRPDEKNVKQYISHLDTGRLGIYDYSIYIDMPTDDNEISKYKKLVRKEYLHYIGEVFKILLGPSKAAKYNPQDIIDIEISMMMALGCDENIKSDPNYYNKISAHELETKYDFDWTTFTQKLGYTETPKNIVVGDLNSIKCMTRLFKENWKTEQWQTYWLFIQFKQMIRFEDSMRSVHYDFYNKFLEGQPAQMPSEIYPIFGISLLFNTFLSEQYVAHNYNYSLQK